MMLLPLLFQKKILMRIHSGAGGAAVLWSNRNSRVWLIFQQQSFNSELPRSNQITTYSLLFRDHEDVFLCNSLSLLPFYSPPNTHWSFGWTADSTHSHCLLLKTYYSLKCHFCALVKVNKHCPLMMQTLAILHQWLIWSLCSGGISDRRITS